MFNDINGAYDFVRTNIDRRPFNEVMETDGNFEYIHITRMWDIIERFEELLKEKDVKYEELKSMITVIKSTGV